jgi:hypothetical protein
MTAILSWFNKEKGTEPYFMTIGDTKISNSETTLLLQGAKILELPIKVRDMSSSSSQLYFISTISYSYAGSSLVGLNIYCILQTIFSNIGGLQSKETLPDYISLSEKAKSILKYFTIDSTKVVEIILSGFCPKSKVPFITIITPTLADGLFDYEITYKTNFLDKVDVVIIGDKKEDIHKMLQSDLSEQTPDDSSEYWRTPVRVLNKIIEEKMFNTIGGGIQMIAVTKYHFKTYSIVYGNAGEVATLRYRNMDIFEDIGLQIGECYVTIPGMQIDLA